MFHEGSLHRVHHVAIGKTFDSTNGFAGGLHGKHQARADRLAIDNHRASAADAGFAADMGSGLPALFTDRGGQGPSRLDANRIIAAVDGEGDVGRAAHVAFPLLRNAARIRCGVAGISSMDTPNGDNASLTALITAAGAPIAPPSPSPLALVIEVPGGVSI